jgi:glycosyltransferase involved in cell wall biosynthesis
MVESDYIPYGADVLDQPDEKCLEKLGFRAGCYDMLVARLEPENNIETILDGAAKAKARNFLVVGNHNTKYGAFLKEKYGSIDCIKFIGGIYNTALLNNLRHFSNLYFHGHTVGGTNPSLLEAMGCGALICAHNNDFNKTILQECGLYFESSDDIAAILISVNRQSHTHWLTENQLRVKNIYNWTRIVEQYETHFQKITQ